MKQRKVLLTSIVIFLSQSFLAQTFFYGPDGKEQLEIWPQMISVTFAKGASMSIKEKIVNREDLLLPYDPLSEIPHPKLTLLRSKTPLSKLEISKLCERLRIQAGVADVSPIYAYADGTLQIPNNHIYARIKGPSFYSSFKNFADNDLHISYSSPGKDSLLLQIKLSAQSTRSTIELANWLQEQGWFDFAEPDFIRLLQPMHTSDPMIEEQWALYNDGENTLIYGGAVEADMNVYPAWNISTGISAIKVAIIDEGVDLQHPDLAQNLLPGYDATGQGSLGAANPADAHGTACAGVVAALGNNGIGIAGVAYNSKVIPIRVAYRAANNWVTTNGWIAEAINWAWQQGQADILSNSWGGGSPSSLINEAIDNALRYGRRGLGSPVVFAAGNQDGELSYPATYHNTIAVTAMSMCNERKSLHSCDGENWWGANYGTGVDVAAPGVKILTLDNTGPAGWEEGDYQDNFNGTSAACPNVAGVLALILSTAPDLHAAEARYLLESSCDKVGGYEYNPFVSGQSNGTWSFELGYGRINAGKALDALTCDNCLGCLDGTLNGQETGIDCGGPNCLPCPTCHDGIQNGDEEDIDCGGTCEACLCFHQTLTLNIQFDHYPEETSWTIRSPEGVTIAAAGPFTEEAGLSTYTQEVMLPEGQYIFTIHDSYGDGICCNYGNGNFELLDANGTVIIAGSEFSAASSVAFCTKASTNTCGDGIQNGEETGVDCGGSCGPCSGLACTSQIIGSSDFESGWDIWQGESMVRRSDLDQPFANSGDWCIRLAGLPHQSGLQSSVLDLSQLSEIEIQFAFTSSGLDMLKEGFSMHLSSNAGKTFTPVADWKQARDFNNEKPQLESVQLQGPFSSKTVFRFQLEGSSLEDILYLDDILISGCSSENDPRVSSSASEDWERGEFSHNLKRLGQPNSEPQLILFPNPTKETLHIGTRLLPGQVSKIEITNIQGSIVHRESINQKRSLGTFAPIHLHHLTPGIYWLQISSDHHVYRKKFMIQR